MRESEEGRTDATDGTDAPAPSSATWTCEATVTGLSEEDEHLLRTLLARGTLTLTIRGVGGNRPTPPGDRPGLSHPRAP